MSTNIVEATVSDAVNLTEIMKRTFDEEARKWLSCQDRIDYNIEPPGYDSVEMTRYMIEELDYYKIMHDEMLVGGIIVTITGKSFGRVDRIFVDPDYQGRKIGSRAMELIEEAFPEVRTWDLETSSKQVNNHHFYEKMGYEPVFETDEEYAYIKRKKITLPLEHLVAEKNLSHVQYENCNLAETEYYQVNLQGSSYSNSNLANAHFSNCSLHQSTFQNINLRHSLFADLNLSNSKFRLVTLSGVHFLDTNFGNEKEPVTIERCNLEAAEISNSNLRNVQIKDSDITGMTINGIPVEKMLEAYQLKNEKGAK